MNQDRSFKVRLAEFIHVKTGMYINAEARKKNEQKDREWNNLFAQEPSFVHSVENGVKMKLYRDSVLSRLIYDGFEEEETLFLGRFLRKGDTFVDIGCNVGFFTLQASGKVGDEGKVICFEPSPVTFKRLTDNIGINGFKNITAINKGLSDSEGTMTLNVSNNGYDAWNTFAKGPDDKLQTTVSVAVSTLDKELDGLDKSKISLVKIDVEGWEKFVFSGGEKFFTSSSPVVMVEFTEENTYAAGYFVQELYDIFVNWGYKWYRLKEGQLVEEERRLHYPYDNLIATKDITALKARFQ